jgi:hypothetical protein
VVSEVMELEIVAESNPQPYREGQRRLVSLHGSRQGVREPLGSDGMKQYVYIALTQREVEVEEIGSFVSKKDKNRIPPHLVSLTHIHALSYSDLNGIHLTHPTSSCL